MPQTLMERLKESTMVKHDSAEGSQFQGDLVYGKLSQPLYIKYIGQLFLIHRSLEAQIRKYHEAGQDWTSVVTARQLQEGFLRKDLTYFSVEPQTIVPLVQTKEFLGIMESFAGRCPESLLGFHYVLLGSKHGGKFVAKNVRSSYKLPDDAGALYFDPYGLGFAELWKDFKESMNALSLTDDQITEMCGAAGAMFVGISNVSDALMPQEEMMK